MGFLDKVFGSAGGNDDLRYGNKKANEFLDQGLGQYTNQLNSGLEDTAAYYDPYITQGLDASQLYGDALGLNGLDEQQGFYSNFQNDPGFQESLNQALEAVQGSASARGGLFSGRTQKSLFDTAQSAQLGAYQNRLNRLQGLQGSGQQASSQLGNLTYGTNKNIADAKFGVNQQKAAGIKGLQNSIASSRGSGFSKFLNAGGQLAEAYATGGKSKRYS